MGPGDDHPWPGSRQPEVTAKRGANGVLPISRRYFATRGHARRSAVPVLSTECLDRLRSGLGVRDGVGKPGLSVLRAYGVGAEDRLAGVAGEHAVGASGAPCEQPRIYRQELRWRADGVGPSVSDL